VFQRKTLPPSSGLKMVTSCDAVETCSQMPTLSRNMMRPCSVLEMVAWWQLAALCSLTNGCLSFGEIWRVCLQVWIGNIVRQCVGLYSDTDASLYTHIREIVRSNLCQNTGYAEFHHCFPHYLQANTRIVHQLGCGCFLPRGSSVGIASCYGHGRPGFDSRLRQDFSFLHASRPAVGFTHSPIQWAPRDELAEVKLTTNVHKVPKSRMVELYLRSSICLHGVMLSKGQLYLSSTSFQNSFQFIIHSTSCKSTLYTSACARYKK
jgi:hypothetical protein